MRRLEVFTYKMGWKWIPSYQRIADVRIIVWGHWDIWWST